MEYKRHAPLLIGALGFLGIVFWFGIRIFPAELFGAMYVLIPPVCVVAVLAAWAKPVFWSVANPKKAHQVYLVIRRSAFRMATHIWDRAKVFGALYRQFVRCTVKVLQPLIWIGVRTQGFAAFRFTTRDLLWLTLVVAIVTQSRIERDLLRERVTNLEHSDTVVTTIKQTLCVDETGLDVYLNGLKKLPKMPTNARVRYAWPMILNGPPVILSPKAILPARATSDVFPPAQSSVGGYERG